jgi:hypothetical protein
MSEHERHLCESCLKDEYDLFRHACIHESQAKNDLWFAKYRINDWPMWFYSMEDASLTFSTEEDVVKVICHIQVVGSTEKDSWEWSWGNTNLPEICKTRMNEVFNFGKEKGWARLTTLFLENDQYTGWECVSIASHLLKGLGVYRCGDEEEAVWVVVLGCEFVN